MDFGLLIDGREVPASNGARFERRHPISGMPVSVAGAATVTDACATVHSAATAFASWAKTSPEYRRGILLAASDRVVEGAAYRCADRRQAGTGVLATRRASTSSPKCGG